MELVFTYAREGTIACAIVVSVWLFLRTDTLRPVVMIFAPVVLVGLLYADGLDTVRQISGHVQTAMFVVIGLK